MQLICRVSGSWDIKKFITPHGKKFSAGAAPAPARLYTPRLYEKCSFLRDITGAFTNATRRMTTLDVKKVVYPDR